MTTIQISEVLEILKNGREEMSDGSIRIDGISQETLEFLESKGLIEVRGERCFPASGKHIRLSDEQILSLGPEIHWAVVETMLDASGEATSSITSNVRWHKIQVLRNGDRGYSSVHEWLQADILNGLDTAGYIHVEMQGDQWWIKKLAKLAA